MFSRLVREGRDGTECDGWQVRVGKKKINKSERVSKGFILLDSSIVSTRGCFVVVTGAASRVAVCECTHLKHEGHRGDDEALDVGHDPGVVGVGRGR